MLWFIVGAVIVVGFALAWWTSGRAKGRLSLSPEESHRRMQGEVAEYRAPHSFGPGPIGGGGS